MFENDASTRKSLSCCRWQCRCPRPPPSSFSNKSLFRDHLAWALVLSLWWITPFDTKSGISTANQGPSPRAIAWPIPNFGTFLAQRGLKCSVRQIFPPLYILAVFPSSSGIAISGAVVGYRTGISNSTSNSYLSNSWMYQHLPNHRVPSLFDSRRNQSESDSLFFWTYYKHQRRFNHQVLLSGSGFGDRLVGGRDNFFGMWQIGGAD